MKSSDANLWVEAVLTERTNLLQHDVYEVVTAPPGARILDSQLLFKIKRNAANEIIKYKSRLVVKGYK